MRAAILLLASLALAAGCASPTELAKPAGDAKPLADTAGANATAEIDPGAPPQWRVGDWWTYGVEFVNPPQRYDMTIVVYGSEGSGWLLSGTDRAQNIAAEFSHYPTLGAWSQKLEAKIHGVKIPFFKWPLTDGKTWNDPYRDIPATWGAMASQVETPAGPRAGFDLTMKAKDGQYANYSYTPTVGWFTKVEQGFGSPAVRMTLKSFGQGFDGKVSVLKFTEHMHRPLAVVAPDPATGVPSAQSAQTFTVATGGTLAWGFYYGGAPGAYTLDIQPSAAGETVHAGQQTTDAEIHAEFGEVKSPPPGQWSAAGGGAASVAAFAFGEILEVHDVV